MVALRRLLVWVPMLLGIAVVLALAGMIVNGTVRASSNGSAATDPTQARATRLLTEGRDVFRYDTFGDEAVWGGVLGLQKAIAGAKNGGSAQD
jgi:hypothetical protein